MTYVVGPLPFPNKASVMLHASHVLNNWPYGVLLDGNDEAFVLALLSNHPAVDHKIGLGGHRVCVLPMHKWKTLNFFVLRRDGSMDNWSIKKCVANLQAESRSSIPESAASDSPPPTQDSHTKDLS